MDSGVIPEWVPRGVAAGLDPGELAPGGAGIVRERHALEDALGVFVAAYRAGAKGRPEGLCILYEAAELSECDVARLRAAEGRHGGVVFVAYRRPLRRRRESGDG
ncbi:MAG: hypothetical protein JXQ73_09420 [Phycisphaerae bacterium]|nr:hypothetical protein [Phycisphaerae bacterium]